MASWAGLPFGRGEAAGGFRLLDDPARLELLAPALLRAEAASAGLRAAQAPKAERQARLLDHARLLREHGARIGAPEALAKAARQAEAAGPAGAREAARCALAAAELAGDGALLDAAAARVAEAGPGRTDPQLMALRAELGVRQALHEGDGAMALQAAGDCDAAASALARHGRSVAAIAPELAQVRGLRAELLTGFALRLKDAASAERAAADLADLLAHVDANRLPVLAARLARLRGEALTAVGELTGCARPLTDAATLLTDALAELPADLAPVERARLGRALGHAARALAQACEDPRAADTLGRAAGEAFLAAELALADAGAPALRASLAFERAGALAARALHPRALDAPSLRRSAEAALRAELRRSDARRSPAAWAAVQVALARLYAADPARTRRAQAVLALEGALEVFAEEGLRSLAAEASDTLRGLRAA